MVIKRILKINNSWPKLFDNNRHILRYYECHLLVFCKQTPFWLAAIETLTVEINFFKLVLRNVFKPAKNEFSKILSQQLTNVRFFFF